MDGGDVFGFDGVTRSYEYAGGIWNRFYEKDSAWTNSLSLSMGSETQTFRFNITDLRSDAVVPNSGFDRLKISLSTSGKVNMGIG
jgi:hypothetical protein